MSTPQTTYRLYSFDPDRRIVSADWLLADDDDDAIARARAQGFGAKGEVWDGTRLVAQLEVARLQA